ncbi:MAG: hypothetical protein C5S38_07340 [Candidatus Methanophagaceae archaeon]|nr:MAG: hypothetical protein C5S38_07340 [Methanophagales archaeon]
MIVLDTDLLIEIFDKKSARGEEILGKIEGYDIATTTIRIFNLHNHQYRPQCFRRYHMNLQIRESKRM